MLLDYAMVLLRANSLKCDVQANLVHHVRPSEALLAYSAGHYASWRQAMNHPSFPLVVFGENVTVNGTIEAERRFGETWQVNDATIVHVSRPRQTYWKCERCGRIKPLVLQA